MRTVFDNAMCAHVWAQQTQYEGRSHNGNLYFRERTIFSYGPHFPLASFVDAPDGSRVVFINSRSYSISTQGHKSDVWRAIDYGRGLTVFAVPDPSSRDHEGNLRRWEAEAVEAFQRADEPRRKRTRERNLEAANAILETAERYAATFGIKWKWAGADKLAAKWAREARAAQRRAEALAAQRAEEARVQLEAQRQRDAEAFVEWSRGERDYCPRSYAVDERGSVYMRVNGDELETSMGASVPLAHAVKAFRFIRMCRERGEGFKANGRVIRVGHFTVSEITPQGDMRAGCHSFTWERIAEIAEAVGVADAAPSAEAVEVRAQ